MLVVDNDDALTDVVRRRLEAADYECVTASTGAMGIAVFEHRRPDMVITDVTGTLRLVTGPPPPQPARFLEVWEFVCKAAFRFGGYLRDWFPPEHWFHRRQHSWLFRTFIAGWKGYQYMGSDPWAYPTTPPEWQDEVMSESSGEVPEP